MYLDHAKTLIAKHEGLRLKPYHCTANKLTIGYGRNLDDNGISQEEAEAMLLSDLASVDHKLHQSFASFASLNEYRKAVLVDMVYNLGWTRFSQFKKMIAAIHRGDFSQAANQMLDSRWAVQVGKRANRLAGIMEQGHL